MVAMAASEAVAAALPGIDGFLGTRASLGMDVVVVGLFALLPVLALSIFMVKQGRYRLHKALQIFIMTALLAAIVVFEIDIRLISDWRVRAAPSSSWPIGVGVALGIHLILLFPRWACCFGSSSRPCCGSPRRRSPEVTASGIAVSPGWRLLT